MKPYFNLVFVVVVLSLLFFSCKKKSKDEPVVFDETLLGIVKDLHVAESVIARMPMYEKDSVAIDLRGKIAAIYNMSPEALDVAILELQQDPKRYLEYEKKAFEDLTFYRDSVLTKTNVTPASTKLDSLK